VTVSPKEKTAVLHHYNSVEFASSSSKLSNQVMNNCIAYVEKNMLGQEDGKKEQMIQNTVVSSYEKTTQNLKRQRIVAKRLNQNGEFEIVDRHRQEKGDAEISGRMVCNNIIRVCSKRYTFDDQALKTMAFLELIFGRTIL
jgi:hypothetical protein